MSECVPCSHAFAEFYSARVVGLQLSEVLGRAAWAFCIKGLFVDGEIGESSFQHAFETGLKFDQVAWASQRKS